MRGLTGCKCQSYMGTTMIIYQQCHGCGSNYRFNKSAEGKKVACKKCKTIIVIGTIYGIEILPPPSPQKNQGFPEDSGRITRPQKKVLIGEIVQKRKKPKYNNLLFSSFKLFLRLLFLSLLVLTGVVVVLKCFDYYRSLEISEETAEARLIIAAKKADDKLPIILRSLSINHTQASTLIYLRKTFKLKEGAPELRLPENIDDDLLNAYAVWFKSIKNKEK